MTKYEYNNVPLYYCTNCLSTASVNVLHEQNNDPFDPNYQTLWVCQECGNTEFEEAHVDHWNMLYVQEYDKTFLEEDPDEIIE